MGEVEDLTLSRGRNIVVASAGGAGCLIGVLLIRHGGLAIGWILALAFAVPTLAVLVALSSWGPRLPADGEGLTISGHLFAERLVWSDIRGFSLIGRGRRARVGVVPDPARGAQAKSRRMLLWESDGRLLLPDAAGARAEFLVFYLEVFRQRAEFTRAEKAPPGSDSKGVLPEARQ